MANAKKNQQYLDYVAKMQAMGKQIASYECPSCKVEIKTQAAPEGQVWDTLSSCPHCDELHMKITRGPAVFPRTAF